jgi:DNA mismatch endonuclease (patch repair protein)
MTAAHDYPHPSSAAVTALMKGNRRADTRPERALRSELHRRGLRFRKDMLIAEEGVRVKADIVFPRRRLAVFVDGCFWHGCQEHGRRPRVNARYWEAKLARTRQRDERVTKALSAAGWTVLRFWEHEPMVDDADLIMERLAAQDHPLTFGGDIK